VVDSVPAAPPLRLQAAAPNFFFFCEASHGPFLLLFLSLTLLLFSGHCFYPPQVLFDVLLLDWLVPNLLSIVCNSFPFFFFFSHDPPVLHLFPLPLFLFGQVLSELMAGIFTFLIGLRLCLSIHTCSIGCRWFLFLCNTDFGWPPPP